MGLKSSIVSEPRDLVDGFMEANYAFGLGSGFPGDFAAFSAGFAAGSVAGLVSLAGSGFA